MRPSLFALLPLLLILGATAGDGSPVTAANLLERERFWPYRIVLTEAWRPPGREAPLTAGTLGVLIRVERGGAARIDFSADGKYEVPVEKTDLVENANRIRRGELAKSEPNFIHAIATRLVDSAADSLAGLPPERVAGRPGFLCVFADPSAKEFGDLVAALRPLNDRHRVMTILFAQGAHPDEELRERLRSLGWTVPFVYDFLAEPYTRTLLAENTAFPALLLQTDEGRVIDQQAGGPDAEPKLRAALDAAFGGSSKP